MKKLSIFFGILLLTAGNVWSQKDIPIICQDDTLEKPRSFVFVPNVTLDENVLTFDFSTTTASQVIIMSEDNGHQVAYANNFVPSTQVVVNLGIEGIPEGSYTLWLYAFDKWWWGEFEIEEE